MAMEKTTPKHDVLLNFKAPKAVAQGIRALAEYLGISYGKLLRDLAAEKRRVMRKAGHRIPAEPSGK